MEIIEGQGVTFEHLMSVVEMGGAAMNEIYPTNKYDRILAMQSMSSIQLPGQLHLALCDRAKKTRSRTMT